MRGGMYWTGDLGYRDEAGFFYFAGRNSDWLRVDGENFAAAPVENVLARHDAVVLAAVYAVPSVDVGDEVMAALHLREGATFEPRRVRRVPRAAGRPVAEMGAALRAHHDRDALDRDAEGAEARAATRTLGMRRRCVVAARPGDRVPAPHARRRRDVALGVREPPPRALARPELNTESGERGVLVLSAPRGLDLSELRERFAVRFERVGRHERRHDAVRT